MTYLPLKEPWAHQRNAKVRLKDRTFFALQMAMRTGKTKVILDNFGQLEADGKLRDILVFAPGGVYRTWPKAVEEHVSFDLQSRLKIYVWESGKERSKTKKALLQQFLAYSGPRMMVINIEAISAVDNAYELSRQFLQQRPTYFAVDEVTMIKNESIRSARTLKLAPLAAVRRILTGLLTPRSPLDAFYPFQFLQPGILGHSTYASFKARYANEIKICTLPTGILQNKLLRATGNGRVWRDGDQYSVADLSRQEVLEELDKRNIWYDRFPKISGYKNEEELRDRMAQHSFRVRLEDCYDMPPKMYSMREVEMTKEQKRIYEDLKARATAELENQEHVTALSVISQMVRLHQVLCGHTRDDTENKLHEIPENRTAELLSLLEEYDGKSIIWCSYDYNVRKVSEAIADEYGPGSVARFWGGNVKTREAEEAQFQNDPKCRFMIGTPQAGGRGRMWAGADLVVYFSNLNNLEFRSQSEERAQGVGKKVSTGYTDLVVKGTVDERIIYALREKIDMAAKISGESWREWLV